MIKHNNLIAITIQLQLCLNSVESVIVALIILKATLKQNILNFKNYFIISLVNQKNCNMDRTLPLA